MAGDWIKIEHWTPDKPEVFQMADALQIDPDAVTGKLIRVWIWADQQTVNGNAPSVTLSLLDRVSGVAGFAQQMIDVGWLTKDGSGFAFANFDRHNGETAKTRALSAKRTARHRTKAAEVTPKQRKRNDDVTLPALPREEKRREEDIYISGAENGGIPERLNTPEVAAAFRLWNSHLESKDPSKTVIPGSPQAQVFWKSWLNAGADGFVKAVEYTVANGWINLRQPEPPRAASSPQPRKGGFRMLDEV